MAKLEIYSASACPYAHRTRLTLIEKGVDFQLKEIDLNNKPEGFKNISPYGKVPVIRYGSDRIWESFIINEYLDEVFPAPPLMPSNAGERALARIWIDFANTKFIPVFYKLLLTQDPVQQKEWAQELGNNLLFIEREGISKLSHNGPYWFGESISLVNLSYYPWFERWCVIEHYRNLKLPSECLRLQQWWTAMSNRASVKAIKNTEEFFIEQYVKYANGTASGITAQEMRSSQVSRT